jgi:hypothetical protein
MLSAFWHGFYLNYYIGFFIFFNLIEIQKVLYKMKLADGVSAFGIKDPEANK